MNKFTILKHDRSNIYSVLIIGITLISLGILDVFLNTFFKLNLFGFFPKLISFLFPFLI